MNFKQVLFLLIISLLSVQAVAQKVCPKILLDSDAQVNFEGRFINEQLSRTNIDIQWKHHVAAPDTFLVSESQSPAFYFITNGDSRFIEYTHSKAKRQLAQHHLRENIGNTPLKFDDLELLANGLFKCTEKDSLAAVALQQQDSLRKDSLAKSATAIDSVLKDSVLKDSAAKDSAPKYSIIDTLTENSLVAKPSPKDTIPKDSTPKDAFLKTFIAKDTLANTNLPKDSLLKKVLSKYSVIKDSVVKDSLLNMILAEHSFAKKDSVTKDSIAKDSIAKDSVPNVAVVDSLIADTTVADTITANIATADTTSADTIISVPTTLSTVYSGQWWSLTYNQPEEPTTVTMKGLRKEVRTFSIGKWDIFSGIKLPTLIKINSSRKYSGDIWVRSVEKK